MEEKVDEVICEVCDGCGEAIVIMASNGRQETFGCPNCDGEGVIVPRDEVKQSAIANEKEIWIMFDSHTDLIIAVGFDLSNLMDSIRDDYNWSGGWTLQPHPHGDYWIRDYDGEDFYILIDKTRYIPS